MSFVQSDFPLKYRAFGTFHTRTREGGPSGPWSVWLSISLPLLPLALPRCDGGDHGEVSLATSSHANMQVFQMSWSRRKQCKQEVGIS